MMTMVDKSGLKLSQYDCALHSAVLRTLTLWNLPEKFHSSVCRVTQAFLSTVTPTIDRTPAEAKCFTTELIQALSDSLTPRFHNTAASWSELVRNYANWLDGANLADIVEDPDFRRTTHLCSIPAPRSNEIADFLREVADVISGIEKNTSDNNKKRRGRAAG